MNNPHLDEAATVDSDQRQTIPAIFRGWSLGFLNNPYNVPQNSTGISPSIRPLPAESPIHIVLMGHSFITKIAEALEWDKQHDQRTISDVFKLELTGIFLTLLCKSGARLEDMITWADQDFPTETPDAVVIDLGSNDLCYASTDPMKLSEDMVQVLHTWLKNGWTQAVVICQVTHRNKTNEYMEKGLETYNHEVDAYNAEIVHKLQGEKQLMTWRHEGLMSLTDEYSTDGLHPNTVEGFNKYINSIWGAIQQARHMALHS